MAREQQLSAVLSEFARTLVTDMPLQGILDHLITRIVEVLPITAAGVTLLSPGRDPPHLIAASDDAALRFEQLQTSTGQGPCITAYATGTAVTVPDLRVTDDRFPDFCTAATEAGLAAVFTFPLEHGDGRLGALDLYRDTPGPLAADDIDIAQTLAEVTAAYLLNARARQDASDAADLLRTSGLHDALTGLPNRVLLQQRLEHAADRARRTHRPAAVLFVDLDRFKQINDTHGHSTGDALLVAVARRLSGLPRPGDTLARISGDEFVLLCEDLGSQADVDGIARRFESAFRTPFLLDTIEVSVTASIGMAFAGRADQIGPALLRDADTAMYQVKRKGGGARQLLDVVEAGRVDDRRALQYDLRQAYDEDQLAVSYQPLVRPRDGLVTGVEALVRWNHPRRGRVSSAVTISVAEQDSLIIDLGLQILCRACHDHSRWTTDRPWISLDLAVNVSGRQLMSESFVDSVVKVLQSSGMNPSTLVLEVDESCFLDGARALTVLADLRDLGVRLALDHFGSGHFSLSYLRQRPVNIVKIDQSFISDIGRAPTGEKILAAVTDLAHALTMSVTAQGVQTAQQRDGVVTVGGDSAQGLFYGAAMTADELEDFLDRDPGQSLRLPSSPSVLGHEVAVASRAS